MPKSKRNHALAAERLAALKLNEPTRMRIDEEPRTDPPPPVPSETLRRAAIKPKGIDPFEVAKREFAVDLFELLHWHVPMDVEGEIKRRDKASFYLVFDKCFRLLVSGKLKHWGFEAMDGKLQAMYLWFYWESYGEGYSACPMGHGQLQKLLGWSRNTIKDVLQDLQNYGKTLLTHGIVQALTEYPPFEYTRPQVYRVYLPREFLAERWRQLAEEARRQAGLDGIKQLLATLERDPETQEILPLLPDSSVNSEIQLA